MDFNKFPEEVIKPAVLAETKQFIIKFAENLREVEEAQRLRYEVFNLEQGKGLDSAHSHGVDRDEFDEHCLHLLVIDKAVKKVIGTYRLHLGTIACSEKGFYSAREFSLRGIHAIAKDSLELGRSCVASAYRSGAAVAMLWGGIAELMLRAKLRYMLGCVSLEETDPAVGWALYEYFIEEGRISEILKASPKKKFLLPKADKARIAALLANKKQLLNYIPPLFKGYLRLGCKICGEPAFDGEFGTIDFLIIVDKNMVPERYLRHFAPSELGSQK